MSKPLLLLDVDGTVSPIRGDDGTYPADVERLEVAKLLGPVLVDARVPGWLARLAGHYELVWVTTWGEGANSRLAAPFGILELPWIDFQAISSRRLEDADRRCGCPSCQPSVTTWRTDVSRPPGWTTRSRSPFYGRPDSSANRCCSCRRTCTSA